MSIKEKVDAAICRFNEAHPNCDGANAIILNYEDLGKFVKETEDAVYLVRTMGADELTQLSWATYKGCRIYDSRNPYTPVMVGRLILA